eukprot:scaffold4409_cov369-Prasinococcus_capsulatus_cf.AAC.18
MQTCTLGAPSRRGRAVRERRAEVPGGLGDRDALSFCRRSVGSDMTGPRRARTRDERRLDLAPHRAVRARRGLGSLQHALRRANERQLTTLGRPGRGETEPTSRRPWPHRPTGRHGLRRAGGGGTGQLAWADSARGPRDAIVGAARRVARRRPQNVPRFIGLVRPRPSLLAEGGGCTRDFDTVPVDEHVELGGDVRRFGRATPFELLLHRMPAGETRPARRATTGCGRSAEWSWAGRPF